MTSYSPLVPLLPMAPVALATPTTQSDPKKQGRKFRAIFISTVAFVILLLPKTHMIVNTAYSLIASASSNADGDATNGIINDLGALAPKGVFLLSFIFFCIMSYLFYAI